MFRLIVASCAFAIALSASIHQQDGPSFCHNLDCPKYTVLERSKAGYEKRRYEASKWVATNCSVMELTPEKNSEMFYKLFHYISGNNTAHKKIEMTAPVVTEVLHGPGPACESTFVMHFMVPFSVQESGNIPAPTDPTVFLRNLPQFDVYVSEFGGRPTFDDDVSELQKLADEISDASKYRTDYYFFAGYDGPYTITKRHNEVWLAAN